MEQLFKIYDKWTWERISRHIWYWGGWSAFYVLMNYINKGSSGQPIGVWLAFELTVLPVKIGCAYTLAYYIMPKYLYKKRLWAFLGWSIVTALLFGILLAATYAFIVIPHILKWAYHLKSFADLSFKAVELVHIASLVVCIKFFQNLLNQEKINNELRRQKTEAELKYLKNQVQPHFLFNTLNNLYGMVLSKDKKAPDVVVKLSNMLGYSLYDSEESFVVLDDEVEYLENYISLERIRYGAKLDLQYQKCCIPRDTLIAPLILIPFVENAFKHGPAKQDEDARICIDIKMENGALLFKVTNTYEEEGFVTNVQSGIGLANVKKRLELLYPDQHQLTICKEEEVFRIELRLILNTPEDD